MRPNIVRPLLLTLGLLSLASGAQALDRFNKTFLGGLALDGYDAVAYFTVGKPVKGSADWAHEHGGATWRFSSSEHRDLFVADPERYAPQFGGYCAWAVANGYTADIDPEAFAVVDGKLFLNYNRSIQKKWEADRAALIGKANENWPKLLAGK